VNRVKRPRIRLKPATYSKLHQAILERDGWRCQLCGSRGVLEVHHITARSKMGDDTEENLITLCSGCHRKLHLHVRSSESPIEQL